MSISVLTILTIALMSPTLHVVATPAPEEQATDASCKTRHEAAGTPAGPEVCTASPPWWSAWGTCDITPIQSQRWLASAAGDAGLERLPWVIAAPEDSGIIGHLFMGSRPLPVDHTYPDGSYAKVLWRFSEGVRDFRMTATNVWDEQAEPITIVEDDGPDAAPSSQWPSYVSVPSAGCWEVQVSGVGEGRERIEGTVTFIAIEG